MNYQGTMRERTPFPEELITSLPNLKLLLTTGTRNNALSLPTLTARGIPVAGTNTNLVASPESTTQHCVALILSLARDIPSNDLSIKSGGWQTGLCTGLAGKVYGVVGLGKLGAATARIMHAAFGMKVVAWSSNLTQEIADAQAVRAGVPVTTRSGENTFKVVSKEELLRTADVVSLHLVLSDRSRNIVSENELALMKPTSFLVNTARGPLIKQEALLDVVNRGAIKGVALDVFDLEPLPADSPWRRTDWGCNGTSRVILTPHTGYAEEEILTDWYKQQAENIIRWARGKPMCHVIDYMSI